MKRKAMCFGYLRGVRDRAVNLELVRIKEGDTVSFPYNWLGPSRFLPRIGIMLLFSAGELYGVRIRGRNLNALLDEGMSLYDRGLMRHRVTYIREMNEGESQAASAGQCVVDRIEITPVAPEAAWKFLGF